MAENKKSNATVDDTIEVDLVELFRMWLSKWPILLIGLLVGAILAVLLTNMKTPMYQSSATLYVLNKTTTITSMSDLQIGAALSKDFVIIATSKPVLDTAVETVNEANGTSLSRKDIKEAVTVTNISNTRLLTITAEYSDPVIACDVAAAVSEATANQMANIMKTDPPTTVEYAEIPSAPVSNGLTRNVLIGAAAGFAIVAIAYLIPFMQDDTIRSAEDVERYLGTTVIGMIPLDKGVVQQENLNRSVHKTRKKTKLSRIGAASPKQR